MENGVHETGRGYRKVRGMCLSYNRPSVSLGASRGHRGEIFGTRPSVDGQSDGEVIHIEGSRVTGQGGRHNCSKSNGSPGGARTEYTREVRRRLPETYWEENARTRGEHSGRDLTGVGGNGVRTQVLTGSYIVIEITIMPGYLALTLMYEQCNTRYPGSYIEARIIIVPGYLALTLV